jgi:hypothetical protein
MLCSACLVAHGLCSVWQKQKYSDTRFGQDGDHNNNNNNAMRLLAAAKLSYGHDGREAWEGPAWTWMVCCQMADGIP